MKQWKYKAKGWLFKVAPWRDCLFNLYAEYIMRNAGLEEAQAGIKIAGRNIKTEAEDMKKRWQEYTEELYKKRF